MVTLAYHHQLEISYFCWNFFFLFALKPFRFSEIAVAQSWSLYIEELFYFSFPLFLELVRLRLVAYTVICFSLAAAIVSMHVQLEPGQFFFSPFNTFGYFAYGIAAYYAQAYLKDFAQSIFLLACTSALALGAFYVVEDKGALIPAMIFLCFAYLFSPPIKIDFLFIAIFSRIGKQCYSFYLVHIFAIEICETSSHEWMNVLKPLNLNPRLLDFAYATILSLVFSWILFTAVENVFIGFGKKIDDRLVSS